jgi:molecular chaperone GrpE
MSIKQQETQREPNEAVPEFSTPPPGTVCEPEQQGIFDSADSSADAFSEAPDAARTAALESELSTLREELSVVNDKYLRKLADDINFRKRMAREKEDGQRFALSALLGDLIPIMDDLDRAIASAETKKDYTVLHDGVLLIKRQLGSVLESKYGLARFESLGKPFDPNHHEAVAMIPGGPEDGEEAIVAEEFLPGYGLHDRILRTAKVRVRMPPPRSPLADARTGASDADKDAN